MNIVFKKDLFRYYGGKERLIQRIVKPLEIKYISLMRKWQASRGLMRKLYSFRLLQLSRKTQIQIPASTNIGAGFYIGHCGRIIVNKDAVLGKNVNIATGVTIGQENRGSRIGVPTIGDKVWIGTNAVVVGNVHIGDDVLIAPLTYVNFDVPAHSVVIGNPGRIIHRENATEAYINNTVD